MVDEDIKEFLISLERTPAKLSLLLADVPSTSVTIRQAPDEFSVLETICHLRDIEIEGYGVRIRRILQEEDPVLSDIDGSRLAIERNYNRQDPGEATSAFTNARRENLSFLNTASESDFEREGELEGVGKITLTKLVQMMRDHDEGHIEELENLSRHLRKNI